MSQPNAPSDEKGLGPVDDNGIPLSSTDRLKLAERYANRVFGPGKPGQIAQREAFLGEFMGALRQMARPLTREEDPTGMANYKREFQGKAFLRERLNTDPAGFDTELLYDAPDVLPKNAKRSAHGSAGARANDANFDNGFNGGRGLLFQGHPTVQSPREIAKAVIDDMRVSGFSVVGPEQTTVSSRVLTNGEAERASLKLLDIRQILPANKP